ncbi:hypothetical protein NPIL_37931 [Nephila pilipes]|uniref:Uncharacterized protein n=1 Tax=Nephila pilipes TaxID=299642 RepID=A0A8X6Q9S6_NEPPI|nr:hypothetical protein NPIL_37931 [Nephila pilipes]
MTTPSKPSYPNIETQKQDNSNWYDCEEHVLDTQSFSRIPVSPQSESQEFRSGDLGGQVMTNARLITLRLGNIDAEHPSPDVRYAVPHHPA